MEQFIKKASHLIEALPYIRRFYGKTFVVKCGGAAMTSKQQLHDMMQDIALLHFCGIRMVIVHGGGPDISMMCERLAIPTHFSNGLRITDAATMEIAQMVLLGKTNTALVTALNQFGVKAVGLSGHDAGLMKTQKLTTDDLGFVGTTPQIEASLIHTLLCASFIPVIAPVGIDDQGQSYNINADTVASAVAGTLNAEKFILLSDVNGLYADFNDKTTQVKSISAAKARDCLAQKKVTGGMIPKLQACLEALEKGVSNAHILDGNMPHSILLEIFTDQGVGTLVTQN